MFTSAATCVETVKFKKKLNTWFHGPQLTWKCKQAHGQERTHPEQTGIKVQEDLVNCWKYNYTLKSMNVKVYDLL